LILWTKVTEDKNVKYFIVNGGQLELFCCMCVGVNCKPHRHGGSEPFISMAAANAVRQCSYPLRHSSSVRLDLDAVLLKPATGRHFKFRIKGNRASLSLCSLADSE